MGQQNHKHSRFFCRVLRSGAAAELRGWPSRPTTVQGASGRTPPLPLRDSGLTPIGVKKTRFPFSYFFRSSAFSSSDHLSVFSEEFFLACITVSYFSAEQSVSS